MSTAHYDKMDLIIIIIISCDLRRVPGAVPPSLIRRAAQTMDVEKLVHKIERYPVLWDPQHPNYKDNNKKNGLWKKIGTDLQYAISDAENKRRQNARI